jgi:hypothetical protein
MSALDYLKNKFDKATDPFIKKHAPLVHSYRTADPKNDFEQAHFPPSLIAALKNTFKMKIQEFKSGKKHKKALADRLKPTPMDKSIAKGLEQIGKMTPEELQKEFGEEFADLVTKNNKIDSLERM